SHQGWRPHRATLAYIEDVAYALTIYEASERTPVEYVDGEWVRVPPPKSPNPRAFVTSDWRTHETDLPSGRLVLRAASPYHDVEWKREWREAKPGELRIQIKDIVTALQEAVPTMQHLVAEAQRRAEQWRRKAEAEHQRWEAEENERRRLANLKASR